MSRRFSRKERNGYEIPLDGTVDEHCAAGLVNRGYLEVWTYRREELTAHKIRVFIANAQDGISMHEHSTANEVRIKYHLHSHASRYRIRRQTVITISLLH